MVLEEKRSELQELQKMNDATAAENVQIQGAYNKMAKEFSKKEKILEEFHKKEKIDESIIKNFKNQFIKLRNSNARVNEEVSEYKKQSDLKEQEFTRERYIKICLNFSQMKSNI